MKEREYDLNLIIKDFNIEEKKKFTVINEDPNNSMMISSISESSSRNDTIDPLQEYEVPLELSIPEEQYLKDFETRFYSNIHAKLIANPPKITHDFANENKAQTFTKEIVILSKLLDNFNLDEDEIEKIKRFRLQDPQGIFLTEFLRSFNKYKQYRIVLEKNFFNLFYDEVLIQIVHKLFDLNMLKELFNLLYQLQFIVVLVQSTDMDMTQSAVFVNHRPSNLTSKQNRNVRLFDQNNESQFCEYMNEIKEQIFTKIFKSEKFWKFIFSEIFKNNLYLFEEKKIETKENVDTPKNNKNPSKWDLISSFIQYNKKGSEDKTEVARNEAQEKEKKLFSELFEFNMMQCKSYIKDAKTFKRIMQEIKDTFNNEQTNQFIETKLKNTENFIRTSSPFSSAPKFFFLLKKQFLLKNKTQ
jgi:hypothetical protein